MAVAARRLDIGENLLRTRKKAFEEHGSDAFPGHVPPDVRRRRAAPAAGRAGTAKKSRRVLPQPADRTFRFTADHTAEWPVTGRCEALEVSASGYTPGPPVQRQQELVGAIEEVHAAVRRRYGSPRMTAERMRARGIKARAPRQFVRTTDSNHPLPVAANLLDRDSDPERPNPVWGEDITYLPTREGGLYLAVVGDLFSRMVVGWAMAESMGSRLVVDALEMALARRRPGAGLLAHSDRGSRYASDHDQAGAGGRGDHYSMSGVAQCWDNAPVESVFSRLKCELGVEVFAARGQARAVVFEDLDVFYNRVRRHSCLGFVSPAEFERADHQTHR